MATYSRTRWGLPEAREEAKEAEGTSMLDAVVIALIVAGFVVLAFNTWARLSA